MEKKCKNKKCQKPLKDGYKHIYCENCRNQQVQKIKDVGKTAAGVIMVLGVSVFSKVINSKD